MRATVLVLTAVMLVLGSVHATEAVPGVTPDQALTALKEGNARFVDGKTTSPRRDAARRADTVKNGQHPAATVIACSDSREPVEIIFDQGIGDLFIVRVAGNVANTDEIGSAEYGTDHLGSSVLLVLGHTQCGAVTAVVMHDEVHGSIPALVAPIVPAVEKAQKANPDLKGKDLVPAAVEANVFQSMEDLLKRSELISKMVVEGKLRVEGAVYDLDTGKIKWLGPHPQQKALIEAPHAEPAHK